MLQGFFDDLAQAIVHVASTTTRIDRSILYVCSKNDMNQHPIDSCTRAGGSLLHGLTELLGCRRICQGPMELRFHPTEGAPDRSQKVVLGYTGHSLAIAVSLGWFRFFSLGSTGPGWWTARRLMVVSFRRDIFYFRTSLNLNQNNEWCERNDPDRPRHPEFFLDQDQVRFRPHRP